jgi:hypothetical protein
MAELVAKPFKSPDEVREFTDGKLSAVTGNS